MSVALGAHRLHRLRHHPFGQLAPCGGIRGKVRPALRIVLVEVVAVPIPHQLIGPAAIDAPGGTARRLDPVPEQHRPAIELVVVDIPVERLVHPEHKLRHSDYSFSAG